MLAASHLVLVPAQPPVRMAHKNSTLSPTSFFEDPRGMEGGKTGGGFPTVHGMETPAIPFAIT